MTSNGILNDDLTRFVNDLSSDSESESEADFRIDALGNWFQLKFIYDKLLDLNLVLFSLF